jgi:uncharacterized membrane protein
MSMSEQSQGGGFSASARLTHPGFNFAQITLSALGVLDAGVLYLRDSHTVNVDLPCTADGGCEKVAQSAYSHLTILGHQIPIAMFGLGTYVILLTLAMAKAASETSASVRLLSMAITAVSAFGTAYSWYLQYVSHFVLGAFCPYCFGSACVMTILFIISLIEWTRLRRAA